MPTTAPPNAAHARATRLAAHIEARSAMIRAAAAAVARPERDPADAHAARLAHAHDQALAEHRARTGHQDAVRRDAAAALGLTPGMVRLLPHLVAGHPNQRLAEDLHLSEDTVKTHLRRAFARLGTASRAQAAVAVLRANLVDLPPGARTLPLGLSRMEVPVVQGVADGLTNITIGERVGISPLTVKSHLARITRRAGLPAGEGARATLAVAAWAQGSIR